VQKSVFTALALLGILSFSSFAPILAQTTSTGTSSGTIIIGTTNAATPVWFNPMRSTNTYYFSAIWQSLVGWTSNGTAIGELARSWTISPNGTVYTFYLRDGLKWSDGQPLTSADVLFTVNQTAVQSAFWAVGTYGPLLVADSSNPSGEALPAGAVTAPNSTTIVFRLPSPYPGFLTEAGGWPILPQHTYQGFNFNTNNPSMSNVTGSGAFIPTSFTPGVQLTEQANPYYYLGPPHLATEILKFFSDSPSAELALESGQINVLQDVPPTDAGALSKVPGISLATEEDQTMVYFPFNMGATLADNTTNPVSNVLVRQAIAEAIDMNTILNASLGAGHYILANQIEDPNMLYLGLPTQNSSIPSPAYPYSPTGASALLKQAGYPNGFTMTMIAPTNGFGSAGTGASTKILQLVQQYLAAVNITVNLQLLDPSTYSTELFNGQPLSWSMSVQTISESPDGDVGPFYIIGGIAGNAGPGGWNVGGYNNSQVNALLKQEEGTAAGPARVAIFYHLDSIAYEQLPVLPVYYNIELIAYDSNYQGFHFGLGDPEYDYWGDLKPSSISQVEIVSSSSSSTTGVSSSTSSGTASTSTTTTSTSSSISYTPLGLVGIAAAVIVVSAVFFMGVKGRRRPLTTATFSGP
jgi:peptide/nickel transport system substrate-binding protein